MSEATLSGRSPAGLAIPRLASDERLARRAASGDERAFAAIFRRYHQPLYRYCLAILGNPEDAEDALQSTMAKALRSLPGEQRRVELKPWLYRVAHNEAIDLVRRRRGEEPLSPEQTGPVAGLAEEAETRERLRRLLADLGELPERQRGALLMRELSGLGFEEIGSSLGTSAAVARQTVYEARLGLRQIGEGREMDCAAVTRALSDGDGRVLRRRDLRAHLRACPDCRRFGEEIGGRERDLAALSPLPAVAAAGILQGLLGGSGGGGGGVIAALGGGAAKSASGAAALKATATVAVVAALGTAAADRGGLIDAGLPGGDGGDTIGKRAGDGGGSGVAAAAAGSPSRPRGTAQPVLAPGTRARGPGRARAADGVAGGSPAAGAGAAAGALPVTASGPGASRGQGQSAGHGGDAKALPAASAHGQQTAAAHKGSSEAGGNGNDSANPGQESKPAPPPHPPHPAPPAHPVKPEHPAPPAAAGNKPPPPAAGPKSAGTASEAASPEPAIGPDNRHAPAFQP